MILDVTNGKVPYGPNKWYKAFGPNNLFRLKRVSEYTRVVIDYITLYVQAKEYGLSIVINSTSLRHIYIAAPD